MWKICLKKEDQVEGVTTELVILIPSIKEAWELYQELKPTKELEILKALLAISVLSGKKEKGLLWVPRLKEIQW